LFYKNERIAIVIDGHALHTAARSIDLSIDYAAIRKEFAARGKLVHAYFYVAIDEEAEFTSVRKLADFLDYNGYLVRTRPLQRHVQDSGHVRIKASMAVQMALEARDIAPHVDHMVLFTGDGDMVHLVKSIQRLGVRVSVCGTRKSNEAALSDDLRREADNFIELEDLRSVISRQIFEQREPRVPAHSE
jgi:uncharacterized LabA/DUF88 family protein